MYAWQLIICLAVNKAVNKKIKNLASLPCVSPQGTIAIKVHNPKSVIHYKKHPPPQATLIHSPKVIPAAF
jgi:hypothetical protein